MDITNAELLHVIPIAKNGKTPAPDGIQVLKTFDGNRSLTLLMDLLNCIYKAGVIPKDQTKVCQ